MYLPNLSGLFAQHSQDIVQVLVERIEEGPFGREVARYEGGRVHVDMRR